MNELLPCPFCGDGETTVKENGKVWLGTKFGTPSSVSVQHWCPSVPGQPSRMIERIGRDLESAVAAWNMRTFTVQQSRAPYKVENVSSADSESVEKPDAL